MPALAKTFLVEITVVLTPDVEELAASGTVPQRADRVVGGIGDRQQCIGTEQLAQGHHNSGTQVHPLRTQTHS